MIALVSLRRLREGDVLEDADVVLARGSELGQAMLQGLRIAVSQPGRINGIRQNP
jgi:hypothetical protein